MNERQQLIKQVVTAMADAHEGMTGESLMSEDVWRIYLHHAAEVAVGVIESKFLAAINSPESDVLAETRDVAIQQAAQALDDWNNSGLDPKIVFHDILSDDPTEETYVALVKRVADLLGWQPDERNTTPPCGTPITTFEVDLDFCKADGQRGTSLWHRIRRAINRRVARRYVNRTCVGRGQGGRLVRVDPNEDRRRSGSTDTTE